ncbi:DUF1684 domain-containing protein [Deinococcus deserti]|uniref:DUF1684 domain-containing protein n=1 Tax=Deinococcus deserti (strain DSM 17065 / CIP 109153 / LMG 22923 / VCD115) TaxID=546414 RepID=C1D0K2_DEIDV|nr:DUF1684 domain-containing protein [Deinococcus deserti]ACO45376.1 hypothetical protein Deide_05380 [Deinococcus deserti VCD115]
MSTNADPYSQAVQEFRRRKDAHFKAGQGPLSADVLAEFSGLSYYAPDAAWTFTVLLETLPQDASAEFVLQTNTGEPRTMARYGRVRVPLPGGEHSLSVFTPLGEETPARVFIPFRDATSGQETYGAGRYLDAPVARSAEGGLLVNVDFNLAYHPYCAYGDGWTCPLPPQENVLPEAVRAGEKLPTPAA